MTERVIMPNGELDETMLEDVNGGCSNATRNVLIGATEVVTATVAGLVIGPWKQRIMMMEGYYRMGYGISSMVREVGLTLPLTPIN